LATSHRGWRNRNALAALLFAVDHADFLYLQHEDDGCAYRYLLFRKVLLLAKCREWFNERCSTRGEVGRGGARSQQDQASAG